MDDQQKNGRRPSRRARMARRLIPFQMAGWMERPLAEERLRLERLSRWTRLPAGVRVEATVVDDLPAEWLTPAAAGAAALLYLHGGAYVTGSISSHRALAAQLAQAAGLRTLVPGYRLAPEHPYPAALEDALTAYRRLRAQGYAADQLVVAGDSAGGGLALAMLLALRDTGEAPPAAAVLLSPWTDLALSGASVESKAAVDPILEADGLRRFAGYYAGGQALTGPLLSPHYADLHGLPPLLIQAGTDEILLDDARRPAQKARAAGVEVRLEVWEGLFHVFQTMGFLPETKEALAQIGRFIDSKLPAS